MGGSRSCTRTIRPPKRRDAGARARATHPLRNATRRDPTNAPALTHRVQVNAGALAVVGVNLSAPEPHIAGVVAESSVLWAGVSPPSHVERWGAIDPRIAFRPPWANRKEGLYYLTWDNWCERPTSLT